ncbi:MAG: class I SAM-dependent methyltransferase [Candidatus Kapabacteria bacterium]|nr:class I SAM-dependent methyltransferase [Candidatus Kapabacteria bacterium]
MYTVTKKIVENFLQNLIYNILGGIYKPCENVDLNLYNDEEQNKKYLGTYFFRSFTESYTIMSDLFKSKIFAEALTNKDKISILDIGSGTGGNLIGVLTFLAESGLSNKSIVVYSIDGNEIAIASQEIMVKEFNKKFNTAFIVNTHRIVFDNKESFKTNMNTFLAKINEPFDIIMTFKFISEFYNINARESFGFYQEFLNLFQDKISVNGIVILLDIVSKDKMKQRDYITKFLSFEINKYLNNTSSNLSCIFPLSCAFWFKECTNKDCYIERNFVIQNGKVSNDISKVAYRVLARKEFANDILTSIQRKNEYQVSDNTKNPTKCEGGRISKINQLLFKHQSAFVL